MRQIYLEKCHEEREIGQETKFLKLVEKTFQGQRKSTVGRALPCTWVTWI